MRFLTDVNASGALAQWLQDMGHDVIQVADRDVGLPDDEILRWAVQEQRIIVTTDKDFEEMIWRQGKPHSGVLRLENLPRAERRALLEDVLANHARDLASRAIVIAQTRRIRIRRPFRIDENRCQKSGRGSCLFTTGDPDQPWRSGGEGGRTAPN